MSQIVIAPGSQVEAAAQSAAGLVICATTRETATTDHVADLIQRTFRFPDAEMVDAAASMFPAPGHVNLTTRWHKERDGGSREYSDWSEGPFPRLEIGPGIVRIAREDRNRSEKTLQRLRDNALKERQEADEHSAWRRRHHMPDDEPVPAGPVRVISAWSAKSRARMISTICELDLSGIVAGQMLPCMVTLTLPGDWLAVAPDAATAARKFDNFTRAWADKWGTPLVGLWKREFQRRGAPHWHIWTVPPVKMHQMREFTAWLSKTWTHVLEIKDGEERRKSLLAGTGVDFAEGLRARDPKRLAVYFLKESLGGEEKAYQNAAPEAWAGQSIGRFWGRRGIEKAVASAPLEPSVAVSVARVMRRWQRAQGVTRSVRVLRGAAPSTGVLRFRTVRRPAKVMGAAGWIAVNDGASFASTLARYATTLSDELTARRELFDSEPRETVPTDAPVPFAGTFVPAAPPAGHTPDEIELRPLWSGVRESSEISGRGQQRPHHAGNPLGASPRDETDCPLFDPAPFAVRVPSTSPRQRQWEAENTPF